MNYDQHTNHVQHHRAHPDAHYPWHQWSEDETLHIAVCYSNPYRWRTRREIFNDFRRHMERTPNVCLHVGELAYGDRPFEVTNPATNPLDCQFRTESALFHKENVLNNVIQRFPPNWKYGGWCDGDFTFTRHDWALETIHQLQHHPWVQPFTSYTDLSGETYGTGHRPIRTNSSFAFTYVQNNYSLPTGYGDGGWTVPQGIPYYDRPGHVGVGATGGAWCFRRDGLDAVGSLLDVCVLGHADWFMTFGLVGSEAPDMHTAWYSGSYSHFIHSWQQKAEKIYKNIGYVDAHAIHHFHGSKKRRAYGTRDAILVKHKFDPVRDLRKNWCGIYELEPMCVGLRDAIRSYFVSRNEDDPNLYDGQ